MEEVEDHPSNEGAIASGEPQPSTLYVVGTPIGNLEDMTYRSVKILGAVDAIAAEDTRRTGRLLAHFQIKTPQIPCHEHNQTKRIPELVDRLRRGEAIALVSDAGMPGISDPGVPLIQACIGAGLAVVPVPGACAAIAALCASGLATDRFTFEGFLPVKGSDRRDRLAAIAQEPRTQILYEAPHRLLATLRDLRETCGDDRAIAIARELTKRHEQFWRGPLVEAVAQWQRAADGLPPEPSPEASPDAIPHSPTPPILKGEFVLVLAGAPRDRPAPIDDDTLIHELKTLIAQGRSPSAASKELAKARSLPRKRLYDLSLRLGDGG
ncbi:MAG: 16S rRNA (cytidine(1402)-2'-O)-methyltransferase [Cyanobacteria bacterium]|nr:16S rRNA (cytidine(1402)-2'-O)-methyltransferase [Cyanobacteriota bacterium]